MNRREFGKLTIAGGALLIVPVTLTGCTVTTAEIVADGNAVANALNSLATAMSSTNPVLAANLSKAATALQSVTAQWTSGSPTAAINDAAAVVEAVLATIPTTAIYAPLVAIAVAALDVLIANLPTSTAKGMKALNSSNPYRGQANIHHRLGRSPEGDFKAAWNTVAKANPQLNSVIIK